MTVYFGGTTMLPPDEEEPGDDTFDHFVHYIGQVWVHEHEVPTDGAALATFDPLSIKSDYECFLEDGRRLDSNRGLTLEEGWLTTQLLFQQETVCVIAAEANADAFPRISRKAVLPARDICELLAAALERVIAEEHPMSFPGYTYRGSVGHVVSFNRFDRSGQVFTYYDPWPGTSFLAPWANVGDVTSVSPASGSDRLWMIVKHALPPILYAIEMPMWLWRRLHGHEENNDSASKKKHWPTPGELSGEQRQDVLEFYLECLKSGLFTIQGEEDFRTLLERGALWDVDRDGNTLLTNLKRLVFGAAESGNDPRGPLNSILRQIADPHSLHQ